MLTPPNTREVLHNLSHVTDAEERRLVLSAPCKSSDLDPLPWLGERLYRCISYAYSVYSQLIALQRDVSQHIPHTSNDYQSAYRKFHSTETALLKIHNDILSSLDDDRVTALTLLDLSAAFDTIDHTILLRRLGNWFGVSGRALDWFEPYLTGRSQRIKLGNCLSSTSDLSFGVPQGSVLGPLLLTLYTTPLSSLVSGHAIPHHIYADDSQLYVSFSSGNSAAALNGLQSCLASVQSWMSTNKLKLNPDKTEFFLIGNERQWSKYLSMFPIELLGVVMDLHRSRSCATLMHSLYDIFVHSLMLSVHIVLGLPRPLLPFILPSISNRCTPSPLIIRPKY